MHCSEPGLDSTPYSAWAATDVGINVLSDAMIWIMQGQPFFKSPNDTLQVWLSKGEEIEYSLATGCSRSPGAVRVLGLRNTYIKVTTANVNIQFSKLLMDWAPRCQRGFIPKRNFGVNILELDVAARTCSNSPAASADLPALVALDFGAAFPSLAQSFMLLAFRQMQAPCAFLAILEQLYHILDVTVMKNGLPALAWRISSGIIQG
eukprot:2176498-Pyramimonas_sp.AAC.1